MAGHSWQLQEAKNRFSQVVDRALLGEPQHVTRRGEEVVVVLAAADYRRLARAERAAAPGFVEHLMAMPRDDGDFERLDLIPRETGL
jgi:prevent-host-death family protein